ncbi:MAG: zinc ribbon domain-containing protein, partial [Promethearchaeia archaeon]
KYILTKNLKQNSLSYRPRFPDIAASKNKIYVSWSDGIDGTGDWHIYINNKTLNGDFNYDYVNKITVNDNHNNFYTSIGCDINGSVFVLWGKYRNAFPEKGDHFVKQIGGLKYNLTQSNIGTDDLSTASKTSLVINSYNSVYCVWRGEVSSNGEIYLRKLDRYTPHLNLISPPSNETAMRGIYNLNCTLEKFDFKSIEYSYWNDTNNNGIADDTGSWKVIYQTNDVNQINYSWDTSTLNIQSLILRVNATDVNGLSEAIYAGHLKIDNKKPQKCIIINIIDELNNNYTNGDLKFAKNLPFKFDVFDDNAKIERVELYYNESTNPLGFNSSNQEIIFDSSTISDGTYDFYIRAYDHAGNFNDSALIKGIIIDNTRPIPTILNTPGSKIKNGSTIEVDLSAHSDVKIVSFYYYNASKTPDSKILLYTDTNPSDGWNYNIFINEEYVDIILIVNATDEVGLSGWQTINLKVDNIQPTPELGKEIDIIGFSETINITLNKDYTDNDTIWVAVLYKEQGAYDYTYKVAGNETNVQQYRINHPTYENSTHFFILLDCIFSSLDLSWTGIDLQIRASDDIYSIGTYNITDISIKTETPNEVKKINWEVKDNYTIFLSWERPIGATEFLIYRSFNSFNIDEYNLISNISKRITYLIDNFGFSPGEKYCIAKISNTNYTDKVWGPNYYYYLIISINSGNPAKAIEIKTEIPAESPQYKVRGFQAATWPYYFIMYLGILLILSIIRISRLKKAIFKGLVKKELAKIEAKEVASFEKEELDLDTRVPKEISIEAPTLKLGKIEPSLSEELEVPSFEEKTSVSATIEKCPTCGWILSSTAKKCPRCGWQRIK